MSAVLDPSDGVLTAWRESTRDRLWRAYQDAKTERDARGRDVVIYARDVLNLLGRCGPLADAVAAWEAADAEVKTALDVWEDLS